MERSLQWDGQAYVLKDHHRTRLRAARPRYEVAVADRRPARGRPRSACRPCSKAWGQHIGIRDLFTRWSLVGATGVTSARGSITGEQDDHLGARRGRHAGGRSGGQRRRKERAPPGPGRGRARRRRRIGGAALGRRLPRPLRAPHVRRLVRALEARDMGVSGITRDFYLTQNGRVTNALLTGLVYSDGMRGPKLLPALLVVALGAALLLLARAALRALGFRAGPLVVPLVAAVALVEALVFFAGTRAYQVLLWAPATISHTLPGVIGLWAVLGAVLAARARRPWARNAAVATAALTGLACGMLSEPFSIVAGLFAAAAGIVCLPRLGRTEDRYASTWCAAACLGLAGASPSCTPPRRAVAARPAPAGTDVVRGLGRRSTTGGASGRRSAASGRTGRPRRRRPPGPGLARSGPPGDHAPGQDRAPAPTDRTPAAEPAPRTVPAGRRGPWRSCRCRCSPSRAWASRTACAALRAGGLDVRPHVDELPPPPAAPPLRIRHVGRVPARAAAPGRRAPRRPGRRAGRRGRARRREHGRAGAAGVRADHEHGGAERRLGPPGRPDPGRGRGGRPGRRVPAPAHRRSQRAAVRLLVRAGLGGAVRCHVLRGEPHPPAGGRAKALTDGRARTRRRDAGRARGGGCPGDPGHPSSRRSVSRRRGPRGSRPSPPRRS